MQKLRNNQHRAHQNCCTAITPWCNRLCQLLNHETSSRCLSTAGNDLQLTEHAARHCHQHSLTQHKNCVVPGCPVAMHGPTISVNITWIAKLTKYVSLQLNSIHVQSHHAQQLIRISISCTSSFLSHNKLSNQKIQDNTRWSISIIQLDFYRAVLLYNFIFKFIYLKF